MNIVFRIVEIKVWREVYIVVGRREVGLINIVDRGER